MFEQFLLAGKDGESEFAYASTCLRPRSGPFSFEDYREFCRSRGEEPEKPFSGKFMVRVDPSLHRELTMVAAIEGKSVQSVVREAIQERVVRIVRPQSTRTKNARKNTRKG
ncbi:MAG: type II toxin-antitoxin system HicB family antitoxin [Gemmatimonadaceae bacterium]|nr:type II toxin-antitoxin system HicB family antitoxin [Gemmatimonadaceae bacterium]